jgi:hypothetical protein
VYKRQRGLGDVYKRQGKYEKIVETKSTIKSFEMYEDAEDGSGPRVIPQGFYIREN